MIHAPNALGDLRERAVRLGFLKRQAARMDGRRANRTVELIIGPGTIEVDEADSPAAHRLTVERLLNQLEARA